MFSPSVAFVAILSLLKANSAFADCQCHCRSDDTACQNANRDVGRQYICDNNACQWICNVFGVGYDKCGGGGGGCIDAKTKLFSCDSQDYVPASSIVPGDSIRTISSEDSSKLCSEVYFTFAHEGTHHAFEIEMEDSSKFTISSNHLLYIGSSFESREATMAKNVKIGDTLVSSDDSAKKITSIKDTSAKLVNVLTTEGSVELESGVVISTSSFHEALYTTLFYPIRLMNRWIGAPAVKKAEPYLTSVGDVFTPYVAMVAESL